MPVNKKLICQFYCYCYSQINNNDDEKIMMTLLLLLFLTLGRSSRGYIG